MKMTDGERVIVSQPKKKNLSGIVPNAKFLFFLFFLCVFNRVQSREEKRTCMACFGLLGNDARIVLVDGIWCYKERGYPMYVYKYVPIL